jgi:hypothetical protein
MTKTMEPGNKELLDGLAKVILALTGLAGGVVTLLKVVIPWAESRRGTANGLDQLQVLHDTMKSCHEHGAERVIIFYGHNSGGIPKPGSPFYATAVHWEKMNGFDKQYGRPEESIRDYAMLPVDGAYIEMLNEMRQSSHVRFTPSKTSNCLLKHIYEKNGMSEGILVFLGIYKKRIYYMSFAKYEKEFNDAEITALLLKANLIRGIISKAQK